MPGSEPRVTHFNDCAFVGQTLVNAAHRAGHQWRYVPPEQVRPASGFRGGRHALAGLPYMARHQAIALRSDVIHIHYATTVPLLQKPWIPKRPYVLHLHGTDIRKQWAAPETHDLVQRAIDGAHAVYYTNLDTAEAATTARADAEYMPILVDPATFPVWTPASDFGTPTVLFVSRWDESKGVETQLAAARALRRALPGVRLVGLDWGPGAAEAASVGVELVARRPHAEFLDLIAKADVAIGQSSGILAISELEAMGIGPALFVPVPKILSEGPRPPVSTGTPEQIAEEVSHVLMDPKAVSYSLHAREWVAANHTADRWVPELERVYRSARK